MGGGDNRMKAKFALMIKSGAISQERAYELASHAVGRVLVPGFGLSTCDHREILRALDAVVAEVTGKPQRSTPRLPARRPGPMPLRRDGEPRATIPQYALVRSMAEELRLSDQELAGVARQACQKEHPITALDLYRVIAALKDIKKRRAKQRAAHGHAERGLASSSVV